MPETWTTLALILRPQGRKGEVLAELLTDFPDEFQTRTVYLAKPGFTGPAEEARPATVTNHWMPVGRNEGRIVLALAGIDSITGAETLAGLELITAQRVALNEDEEYIDDLLDCVVFNDAQLVGKVTAVDFPTTPDGTRRLPDAAPLLTVQTAAGDEVLIPYVQSFLTSLSVAEKRIDMILPEGLVELNRTGSAGE